MSKTAHLPPAGAILETLPMSVVLLDADGACCYANAAARALASVLHSREADGLRLLLAQAPAQVADDETAGLPAGGCEDRLSCIAEDGRALNIIRQWRRCEQPGLSSVTIRPARGDAAGVGPPNLADRERQALQNESLAHAEKLATVGQLAAGMAHEINNPICYVQSNLGTLQDYMNRLFGLLESSEEIMRDYSASAGQRTAALKARREAADYGVIVEDLPLLLAESREGVERIRQIVQNLRDFSRADSVDGYCLYDLHRAVETTLGIVRSLTGSGIRFDTHFGLLPLIECNPTELNQVLMNILVNASQAVDSRGVVELRTGSGEDRVWIEIRDNGCGIEEAALPHIFEPFFTTKAVGNGTGLGLSITYGFVKKHGGDISVKSRPGEGTAFLISLPVKQPTAAPAAN